VSCYIYSCAGPRGEEEEEGGRKEGEEEAERTRWRKGMSSSGGSPKGARADAVLNAYNDVEVGREGGREGGRGR